MQALTDNALMLQVKSGQLDKLGLLYERYKKQLFGFFYHMNSNAALSEDLVQNVFVRIMKYRHTFTGDGSFAAWLFRMARNVSHDHFRKHGNLNKQADLDEINYKLSDSESFESEGDKQDQIKQLQWALNKLSPEKKEIIILSKYRELKFKEIGEILNCSEGAAKVKAHRAIQDLRKMFLQQKK